MGSAGEFAGIEQPIDGPVQGELSRRPGKHQQNHIGIPPNPPNNGTGFYEISHIAHIANTTNSTRRFFRLLASDVLGAAGWVSP